MVIQETPKEIVTNGIPWNQILKSRLLKMTPWQRSRVTTRNFIGKIPHISEAHGRLCGKETQTGSCGEYPGVCNCQMACVNKTIQAGTVTWSEAGDFKRWSADYGLPVITLSGINWSEVVQAVIQVSQDAVNKSFRDYDALTEVLELRKTAEFFRQNASAVSSRFRSFFGGFPSSDVRIGSRIRPDKLLKDSSRALRKLGAAWLAYRYAVMPLVYSYSDIRKVLQRSWTTKDHSSVNVSPTSYTPEYFPGSYISEECSGVVRVKASVTCMYSSDKVAQMARVSMNPLSTAWELIPYSFVVDWFINVGGFITANFSPDFSDGNNMACVSIRTSTKTTKTLHTSVNEHYYGYYGGSLANACWPYPQPSRFDYYNQNAVHEVLQTVETDSYDRKLFSRNGASPIGSGFGFNWKRITDSVALSHGLVKKLRSFF